MRGESAGRLAPDLLARVVSSRPPNSAAASAGGRRAGGRSDPSTAEHGRGHLTRCHGPVFSCVQLLSYARPAVRSQPTTEGENRMAGFLFRLETPDGTPAEPSSFSSAMPNWAPGETIHFGHRTVRVVAVRDDDADRPPVLVVEEA